MLFDGLPLNVTVGFSTTSKWISRAIRWVTRSPCSHAWIAYDCPILGRVVIQAESWGFELRPWDLWRTQNVLVAEFDPVDPADSLSRSIRALGPKMIGLPYDFVGAGLAALWKRLGRWISGRFRSPRKLMCSEATLRILKHAGFASVDHFDVEFTTPVRLMSRLLEVATTFRGEFELKRYDSKYFLPWYDRKVGDRKLLG